METKTLKNLSKSKPGDILWDKGSSNSVKGLHLKIKVRGSGWYLYYRNLSGTQRRPKIASYPEIDLSDARKIATQMKFQIGCGMDPSLERKIKRGESTLNDIFEEVMAHHWSKKKFLESGWNYEVNRLYNSEIRPSFGSSKLSEITGARVKYWHSRYEENNEVVGNRARSVLSKIFSHAIERGYIPQASNPCVLVKKFDEEVRNRVMTPSELNEIFRILKRDESLFPRETAFIYLLLFTGARPRALERATSSQLERITIEGKTFGILEFNRQTVRGKTKNETLHLAPQALAIIDGLPNDHSTILGIKFPRKFWDKIRLEVGCPDLWARDARRTFGSVGLSEGEELGMISALLNHKEIQTTKKIYAKASQTSQLKVSEKIAGFMQDLMEGK